MSEGTKRQKLSNISHRAYEHPADRAALTALRKLKGVDLALKKIFGLIGERSLTYLYLGSAVRVSHKQFRAVYRVYRDCLDTLDFPGEPELYVAQTPFVNAGAIGLERPFIVLNSGTIEMFGQEELRCIIGHELGHILSDHVLYKTMLRILLKLSPLGASIPLGGLAVFAILTALGEWDRKSELSCDRAGLLCAQDPALAFQVLMQMAGGSRVEEMCLEEFVAQAEEYEKGGDALDSVFKLLNLMGVSHPFHVIRLSELQKWVDSGGYARILSGDYETRDQDEPTSVYDDFKSTVGNYRQAFHDSQDPLASLLRDLGQTVADKGSELLEQLRSSFTRPPDKPEDKR